MNNDKIKNRHLPIYEYLEKLQIEYFSYAIRSKIYPIPALKDHWLGAMEKKHKTIEEVASKYSLPNIFSDKIVEDTIRQKFYEFKTPNFQYRNEDFRKKWEYWDKFNYYASGNEVRIEVENETLIGKIVEHVVGNNFVYVNVDGITNKYQINQVYRII